MTKSIVVGADPSLQSIRDHIRGHHPDLVVVDEIHDILPPQLPPGALTMNNDDATRPLDPNLVENIPRRAMRRRHATRLLMALSSLLGAGGSPNGLLAPAPPTPPEQDPEEKAAKLAEQDPEEKAAKLAAAEAKRARKNRARLGGGA